MQHTKFIQVNKYYYRCEITNLLYFGKKKSATIMAFKCASRRNYGNTCNKYIADVEFLC